MKRLSLFWSKKYKLVSLIGLIVVFVVVAVVALKFTIFASTTGGNCKYLISYDRDGGQSASYLAANINRIESMTNFPYNGVIIHSSAASSVMKPGVTLDPAVIANELAPLRNMANKPTKLKHNMIRVLLHYPGTGTGGSGDFFSDSDWTRVANNMATLAQALYDLRASGFGIDGIFFDNEGPYSGENCSYKVWNYPRDGEGQTNACIQYPEKGYTAYQDQVRLRGKQVMERMINNSNFKDIKLMALLDTYFSCTNTNQHPYDNNLYAHDELLGSFTLGMVEGTVNTNARVTDGGEYSYYIGSDQSKFIDRYNYRKTGMPADQPACSFMTHAVSGDPYPNFTSLWSQLINVGHGLYNGSQTTSNIRDAVIYGLQNSDDYVWFYTENVNSIDPSASNYIGLSWMSPIIAGRNAVPNDPNCGSGASPSPTSTVSTPTPTPGSPSPTINPSPSSSLCEPTPAPGLAATVISSTQINLAWTDTLNENGYSVKRSSTSSTGPFSVVYNTGLTPNPHATSWQDTTVSANTSYWYRVDAYNGCGKGITSSNVVQVTTPGSVFLPAVPTSLTASVVSSSRIDLTWADKSSNEDGFVIERSTSSSTGFVQVGTVGANVTSFSSTGLQSNKTYYYRVKAFNIAGSSAYSNTASARTKRKWWFF